MSVYVTQTNRNFTLKQENVIPAYNALSQYVKEKAAERDVISFGRQTFYSLVLSDSSLCDMMEDLGFALGHHQPNEEGYSDIEFLEEEWDDSYHEVLNAIAPYVEDGSFLEFSKEEGDLFRVAFHNGTTQVIHPQVIWPTL